MGTPSDDSDRDFSPDENDEEDDFEKQDESESSSSSDQPKSFKKRASDKKTNKRMKVTQPEIESNSNQSWQRSFGELDLSSSFGSLPGHTSGIQQRRMSLFNSYEQSEIDQQIAMIGMDAHDTEQNQAPSNIETEIVRDDENLFHVPEDDPNQPEDEEFEIDRQLRLAREEEEEASLGRRLLAPSAEIRIRNRPTKKGKPNDDMIQNLRKRQFELVNLQINLHKVLLENAKITQQECKEKLLLAQTLRMNRNPNAENE